MLKTILIAAAALILVSLMGYQAYRRYMLNKFAHEFTEKYFGPHPEHPAFGTIKGFANGWEFHASLPTPGLNTNEVQFTIEDDPNETHVQNYELLRAKWPTVWPSIFDALKLVITDYGYTEALSSSAPKLSVSIPDQPFNDHTVWSVILEFESSAGIYDVQLLGWTEVTDSGATF